jgi:hypothetical protein
VPVGRDNDGAFEALNSLQEVVRLHVGIAVVVSLTSRQLPNSVLASMTNPIYRPMQRFVSILWSGHRSSVSLANHGKIKVITSSLTILMHPFYGSNYIAVVVFALHRFDIVDGTKVTQSDYQRTFDGFL